jgi:hypothetical protein
MASTTGCLVSSLHPFYKSGDKRFDPAMVGYWMDDDSCIWTIFPSMVSETLMAPEKPDSTYAITYYEEENQVAILTGTLFNLNGVNYVDFAPRQNEAHCTSDMTCYHHVPVHTLARVQYNSDSILMFWYGESWLEELFEQNRIRINHETVTSSGYDRQVLTASTDELQKFIRKYANDPKTVEEIEKIFAKGKTDNDDYGLLLKLKPFRGELPANVKKPDKPV